MPQNLTAMASRRSLFNRNGSLDRSFIGGLAPESAVNRGTKSLIALLIVRRADRDSQNKNHWSVRQIDLPKRPIHAILSIRF